MRAIKGLLQMVFFLLLIFVSLLAAGVIANRLPLTDPPGVMTRLAAYLNTNVAETTANSPFPELKLRRYAAPPALLFDIARRAVQALGWELTELDTEQKTIKAVVTTRIWQFKDDVTIRVEPAPPNGSFLHVRSASRVGKGDLGANTRHVVDLIQAVNTLAPASALLPQYEVATEGTTTQSEIGGEVPGVRAEERGSEPTER